MKRYLALWEQGEDGLVVPRKGGWMWGDWGKNKDMPLLFNGWYFLALKGQAKMALSTGDRAEAAKAQEKMRLLKEAFNRNFWTGTEYRSPHYKGPTDDRGQALAVVSGMADTEKFEAIAGVFNDQMHSSPYMEKYVIEALYQMEYPDRAIARLRKRYKKMVAAETTTLWEGWGIGAEGFGGGTINHAWSGGPLTIMSQYIAGIRPTKPGYQAYEVRPQLGSLNKVQATVATVAGELRVEIEKSPGQFDLVLTSPPNTTGIVCLPAAGVKEVSKQGALIWSSVDGPIVSEENSAAVKFSKRDDRYLEFEVRAGTHSFRSVR